MTQSVGTRISEARAKRHRNRRRTLCVCVGKVSTCSRQAPSQAKTRDCGKKMLIDSEDSPCFTALPEAHRLNSLG